MSYHFPPPVDWQVFQRLVAGFARSLYDTHTVAEYGRTGQRQNGVDVFARDLLGNPVGLQCKWTSEDLAETALAKECGKALEFRPRLEHFVLWTTSKRDVHLQDVASRLNESGDYPFSVTIRFWDDAIDHLNRAYSVANLYYGAWIEDNGLSAEQDHRQKLLVAFDRPAFRDPIHLERNFSHLLDAVKDTLVFFRAGLLYDRYDRTLIVQALPLSMLSDAEYKEGLAEVVALLADLERLLDDACKRFGSPMLIDSGDVRECDQIRAAISHRVSRFAD